MRQVLMTAIALVVMGVVMSGSASADPADAAQATSTNHQCPTRWVDPIYDCVQFENDAHNRACARLAQKLNTMCGLKKPDLQTAAALPIFDPLTGENN